MAGIDDIAKKANVSRTAVSFALNNKPGISEETRKRILEVADQLNFKHRKKKAVVPKLEGKVGFIKIASHGHIVNRDHDVFISDYIYGINQECKKHRFELTLFNSRSSDLSALNPTDLQDCKGLIILGTELSETEIINISKLKVPIVFLDTYFNFLPYNFVTMNNKDAMFSILTSLKKKHLNEIKMISTELECANFRERETSFFEVMAHLDLAVQPASLLKFDSTFLGAYEGMAKLLRENVPLPEAFICANDIIALGCIKALKERGINIPQEISITGFDNLPGSSMADPALTSYQVPKEHIGKIGVQILIEEIKQNGRRFTTIKTRVDGKLVERDST